MNKKLLTLCSVAGLAVINAAAAHHSFAWFDRSQTLTLQGTVRTLQWTNPHVWLWVEVPDDKGGSVSWGMEAPSPVNIQRMGTGGWHKNALKRGDKVTVSVHPARSGKTGGELVKVVLQDGRELIPNPNLLKRETSAQ